MIQCFSWPVFNGMKEAWQIPFDHPEATALAIVYP